MPQFIKEFIDDFSHIVFMESKREKTITKEVFHSIELMQRYSKTIHSVLIIIIGLTGLLQGSSLPLTLFGLISIPLGFVFINFNTHLNNIISQSNHIIFLLFRYEFGNAKVGEFF